MSNHMNLPLVEKVYIADCCHCDQHFETWDEMKIHNQLLLPGGGTHTCRNLGFNGKYHVMAIASAKGK